MYILSTYPKDNFISTLLDEKIRLSTENQNQPHGLKKQKFLTELLEAKNLLAIPARRASAESLSSPLNDDDKSKRIQLPTSMSVTLDLKSASDKQQQPPSNGGGHFQGRNGRNCQTRKSILVRQSKVEDHRTTDDEDDKKGS